MIQSKRKMNKKVIIAIVVVVVCLAAGGFWYWHKQHSKFVPAPSSSSETKGEVNTGSNIASPAAASGSSNSSQSPSNSSSPTSKETNPNTNATLVAPSGNFVSSHHVSLGDTLASDCTTTTGATCQISFTKDGVTNSLDTRTTDKGGSAYWAWKPQDIGLSAGTWKIKATATLNGKSLSTDDALNLEVQ